MNRLPAGRTDAWGLRAACAALAPALLLLPGCFGSRWEEARRQEPPPVELLAGAWEGAWTSENNDDGGALRSIIKKRPDGDYDAEFQAKFARILSWTQRVVLKINERTAVWRFAGESSLGFFGVYRCEGWTDGQRFCSNYSSDFGSGIFEMTRSKPPPADLPPREKP